MRSRVSDKKRRIIIIAAVVITVMVIGLFIWKLIPYTQSLHLDFSGVGLDCTDVTVLSDGNFGEVLSDGNLPDSLVTDEVKKSLSEPGVEICLVWLKYSINSEKELDVSKFSVDLKPTNDAMGKLYSYIPITDVQKNGNVYNFRQAFLIDKKDVRSFLLEKELPRPFKGSLNFELSYSLIGSDKIKKVGFSAE